MSKYTKDEKALIKIREGDQAFIKKIHNQYWDPFCSYFFKTTSISQTEDMKEIYRESFTIFCQKIKSGELKAPLKSSLKSYLIGIGKNIVKQYYEKKNKKRNKDDLFGDLASVTKEHITPAIDRHYENESNKEMVRRLLNHIKLGAACKKILILSFIKENADDAIAIKMNIPSRGGVRQKRLKCLIKIRTLIREK